MDISGIAGAGKSRLLKQVQKAMIAMGKTIAMLSPTDASVKDLRKAGFQARTFQGFQLRPEHADLLVIDEASMLSIPQMLWLVKHAQKRDSRVLVVGDSAQHRTVERGNALRILEQSGSVRYVELLQTQRQKVPALKAAIEDLKAGRLQNGWQKLEQHGVIKELTDVAELRKSAVEQHLSGLRAGKSSLMICPRHEEARKVAAIVRQQLKAEGAIGAADHAVTVLRRMDLGSESVAPSTMQVSVGDQIRVTAGFREEKNVFKNNDIVAVRISWISYRDVAEFCIAPVLRSIAHRSILEVGGPEALTPRWPTAASI